MLQAQDSQQLKKLNDYKQEEQNLTRLANSSKGANAQTDNPEGRMNRGPFYMIETPNRFQLPPVPETVLMQEMEEEQEDSNKDEDED